MPSFWFPMLLTIVTQSASTTTLTGIVRDDEGRPIAGATVFISTAAPRKGLGVLCPSCYPDCRKTTVSDGTGRFALEDLDPELKFRLFVVARDFAPAYTPDHVVPGMGEEMIALTPRDLDARKPEQVMRGRVHDENGNPVPRAIVETHGLRRARAGRRGFSDLLPLPRGDTDRLAVTDDNGRFRLGVAKNGDALYLLVKAPFLAHFKTGPLAAGKTVHTISLGTGVTVTGRVVSKGRALSEVGLGMVQTDRDNKGYLGRFEFGTDSRGQFSIANMPPHQKWYIYGLMDTLKSSGCIPVQTVTTGAHGSTLDLGDLEVQPGFRISGRMVLADGKAVPPDTQVILSRERGVSDSQTVRVGPDGHFTFDGVPAEHVQIFTKVSGYHPSQKIPSLDVNFPEFIFGKVTADIQTFLLPLEPGPAPKIDYRQSVEEEKRRRAEPLRGAPVEKPL